MSIRALARAVPLLAVALVAACGGSTENKRPGPPATIVLLSSPMFTATVGTSLQAPLRVRVTDDRERPVPDVTVQFNVAQGSAEVTPASDVTDAEGVAETTIRLLGTAGAIRVSASVSGVAASVSINGVSVPGPLARIVIQPKPLLLPGVGATGQLVVTQSDQFGNAVAPATVSWRSLDESIATVDAAGLVTGRRIGASTQVIGTVSPTLADTVTVSVADPNASVCASAPVTLAPGESMTMDPATGACLRATVNAQFVAVPFFATTAPNNTTGELQVLGNRLATFTPSVGVTPSLSVSAAATVAPAGARPALNVEQQLREEERRTLMPRIRGARQTRQARTSLGDASFASIPNTLIVGDYITLNTSTTACSAPNNRVGRVVAISQKAVIVADTTNPAGGFTDADYVRIATTFDTLVVPVDEQLFGVPGDNDANGRSVIFYTGAVNDLTPNGSGSYVGGFFFARDLFPKTGEGSCTTSNDGEIFYMLVADPDGVLGNRFSKAFVERVTVGTLAHEYQHLINASRRMANPLSEGFEVTWLNEGLSHIAEEFVFYRAAGVQPRSNLGGEPLGSFRYDNAFTNYMLGNIGRLNNWLTEPQTHAPYRNCGSCTPTEDLAARGSAWILLRYLADRVYTSDGDVWMRLANSTTTGMTNLEQAFGINTVTAVRDWSIAMYMDDYATNPRPEHRLPSWNFRSLYPGLSRNTVTTQYAGPYPLKVNPLVDGVARTVTLRGGSAAYFPFAVAAGTDAKVHVTTIAGAPVPSGVTVTVLRVR